MTDDTNKKVTEVLDNLKNPKIRKRLVVALLGLLIVIVKDVFELPIDDNTINSAVNLLMVYITGQSATDIFAIIHGSKKE